MFLSETSRYICLLLWSFLLLASDCQLLESTCAEVEHGPKPGEGQQVSLLQTVSRGATVMLGRGGEDTVPAAALEEASVVHQRASEVLEQAQPIAPLAAAAAASVAGFKVSESLHSIFVSASSQTVASLTVVVVIALLALAWCWPCEKNPVMHGSRSTLLDNAKVVAQFLVIYCNIFNNNLLPDRASPSGYSDWETWLSGSQELLRALLDGFSAVMIPMLCFISGVLSQGPTNERRMRRFLEVLVVPVLIWVYLAKPIIYDMMMDPHSERLVGRLRAVLHLQSFHEEWYLQALILWRGSVFILWSHLRAGVGLIAMFALSGMAGYLNLNGPLWYLKLDETLGFLPYFALGYFFPFDAARKVTERRRMPWMLAIGLVIVWVFGLLPMVGPLPNSHGNYHCCAAGPIFRQLQPIDYKFYWTRRLTRVALEMPPTLMLIFYVVPRSEMQLSWVGRHMLYPYLFHRLANHWRSELVRYLQPPVITHTVGHIAVLALHAPYVIGLLVLFASWPWRMLFAWCLEPTWLKPLLAPSQGSKNVRSLRWHNAAWRTAVSSSGEDASLPAAQSGDKGKTTCNDSGRGESKPEDVCNSGRNDCERGDAVSNPELELSRPATRKWQSTGPELPWQQVAKKYYRWLWCIFSVTALAPAVGVAILVCVWPGMDVLLRVVNKTPAALGILAYVAVLTSTGTNYIWHYFCLRSSDDLPEPTGAPPLQHAVIIVAYKEPLEVLTRTVDSIVAQRGLSRRPIVVFASESRDPTAQEAFTSLSRQVGDRFDLFLMTKHILVDGETVGKSSNENHAVKELYDRLVEEQGRDPFEVLVTIVDADSILSSTYLAHVEAAYRNMSDGRRFIYSGPLNVHRNFADACLLVQAYELNRCHIDMFHNPFVQYQPQSNYSLALGFAQEIGFWTPDVMPEDIHTANRACVHNLGSYTTVPIPSIICNDVVTDFWDRYTQAKRHQWGSLTEFAWSLALFFDTRKMSFQAWWPVFRVESGREGSFLDIALSLSGYISKPLCLCAIYQNRHLLTWKIALFAFMYLSISVWRWLWFWAAELVVWQTLLAQFPIKRPSLARWSLLVCLMPVLLFVGTMVFYLGASLHCLVRITTIGDLTYIAAPKGDAPPGEALKGKPDEASGDAPGDLGTKEGPAVAS